LNVRVNLQPLVIKRILTGATAFGALLPWVSVGPVSITGTSQVEGKLALLAGLLGLFLTFSSPADPRARTFEAVLAGAALLGSGWFWFDNFGRSRVEGFSAGYGLLLCAAAALGWSVLLVWDSRRATGGTRRPRGSRDWR
jgi:hypothetical protein